MIVRSHKTVQESCRAAKVASRTLAALPTAEKNRALGAIGRGLADRRVSILEANRLDVEAGLEDGLDAALIDRLALDDERIEGMARGLATIADLPDPVGRLIEGRRLPNGLDVRKIRVPLGVVAIVYEARPNVTIDTAGLCLKSGNAVVLRGSSSALNSNVALWNVVREALTGVGIPDAAVTLIEGGRRSELAELATQNDSIDVIVPRGGERLKAALQEVATVPVIYAAAGNCHVYVDAAADLEKAVSIVLDAKTDRPGVCNAAETVLVHREIAKELLPALLGELDSAGVELRVDAETRSLAGALSDRLIDAEEEDWEREYLALVLAVKVVGSLQEAIDHIERYGSGHSEAIVTDSYESARRFSRDVDAACVYVNASTRFTDGGEFGLGAELGNSTQKLHARGPIAMDELTTYKYVIEGSGHVRSRS